jgi:hypothetical protein
VTGSRVEVAEPAWCEPGLDSRGGRYPLAVEAPVMAMVDTLVPGVSTLTRLVRFYSLYWALAAFAEDRALDVDKCRTVLRRAEVGLAWVSLEHDGPPFAHGADRVKSLRDNGRTEAMAEVGQRSYSPRQWGFWSQYGGPSTTIGTVEVDGGALRPGRHRCPDPVRRMYQPLFELVARRSVRADDVAGFAALALDVLETPDLGPLGGLFTATDSGSHGPDGWTGDDRTRRSTLRILARSVQLEPDAGSWTSALRACVAYGDSIDTDPVLREEDRAQAWRGVLLRHWSVGAWRRLWAALVEEVRGSAGSSTRADLHEWISSEVPPTTVRDFLRACPSTTDGDGHPLPAEAQVVAERTSPVESDLAVLLLGTRRLAQLTGKSRSAFLGRGQRGRGQFLDPSWMEHRRLEHENRPVAELARAVVDDMLAQSRRVSLRKLKFDDRGRMTLFTKLHERNGRYFADIPEGAGNVGLRIQQLGTMSHQLDLFAGSTPGAGVTPLGARLLELPS